MGFQGSKAPLVGVGGGGVFKEPKDITHVGCQFNSDFRTENKYRVTTHFKFQIRLPQCGPMGSRGPEAPLGGGRVSKEPNDIRHFVYQFFSDFSTENQYRVNKP